MTYNLSMTFSLLFTFKTFEQDPSCRSGHLASQLVVVVVNVRKVIVEDKAATDHGKISGHRRRAANGN